MRQIRFVLRTKATNDQPLRIARPGRRWLLAAVLLAAFSAGAFAQAPANDAFADRATLTGVSATVSASNLGATAETGEPAHAGNVAAKSLWWQWTASQSGRVNVDTFGSAIDTVLAVYQGAMPGGLATIAFNDEAGGTSDSAVAFYAFAGATYYIAVDGYHGAGGNIQLHLASTSSYDLYSTGFESFTPGGDQIIGIDGWASSNYGEGASGVVQDGGSGSHLAYVGYNPTADSMVSVWRPIGSVSTSSVFFNVDLAVIDSTEANGKRDSFFFLLYSASGQLLAGIKFDNADQRIYRYDGVTYHDVGGFARGTGYNLNLWFDFGAGTWTAALNDLTQFYNQPINIQGRALSLGFISAAWLMATPGSPGDNYLLFDNYTITSTGAFPAIISQPASRWVVAGNTASFTATATGTSSPSYQWEISTDGGSTWAPVGMDGSHTGRLTSTLSVTNATVAMNGYRYRCVISNGAGASITSSVATLTVTPSVGVATVATGVHHTLIVRMDGTLWATGDNSSGQLGDGTTESRTTPVGVASDVVAVAAGSLHSLFLKTDGTLWAMGGNSQGQLGDGTTLRRVVPVQIASHVAAMAAGLNHTLFLKTDGTLWATGDNSSGQLGDGTTTKRTTAFQVASGVTGVGAGARHSLFVKADRTLWVMGQNFWGQLGDDTITDRYTPVQMASQVASAAAGDSHSVFIKTDGTLWGTGLNFSGQLGDGTTTVRVRPLQVANGVSSVAAGTVHTLFVDSNHVLFGMGSNLEGQLGTWSGSTLTPFQITTQVFAVSAGADYSMFITASGSLFAMGSNANGQFGDGTLISHSSQTLVVSGTAQLPGGPVGLSAVDDGLAGVRVAWNPTMGSMGYEVWRSTSNSAATATRIASGVAGTLFYDHDASAATTYYYWVKAVNVAGASGLSAASANVAVLGVMPVIATHPASQAINAGTSVTFRVGAVSNAPLSYQWRKGGTPIDGATNATLTLNPVGLSDAGTFDVVVTNAAGSVISQGAVLTVNDAARFVSPPLSRAITAGSAVSFAAGAAGTAPLTFEWRHDGQVIAGAYGSTLSLPSAALSDRGYYEVIVTNEFGSSWSTFRLDVGPQNGGVVAWGLNNYGQATVPSIPNDVVAIAAGGYHSLALRAGGSVVGWGLWSAAIVPGNVMGAVAISAGGTHSLALAAEGTVFTWGDDLSGQATIPVGLRNVVAIAAGYDHSLALRADGTVVAWGNNSAGQCDVPANLSRVVAVAASSAVSQALRSDGTVVAWGFTYNSGHDTDGPQGLSSIREIAAGQPSLALQTDGTLVAWRSYPFPFEVDSHLTNRLPGVVTISAGAAHGLAIKTDGSVVAFGVGGSGQTTVPGGLTNAAAVAAGNQFSLALVPVTGPPANVTASAIGTVPAGAATQFTVAAEGFGLSYQWQRLAAGSSTWTDLGQNGTYSGVTTDTLLLHAATPAMAGDQFRCAVSNNRGAVTSSPGTLTVNLATIAAVQGGDGHMLVLQSDGSLWSTGYNSLGQLGDGTKVSRRTLGLVASEVASISTGLYHSLFRKFDGTTWAMGYYPYDGVTATSRSTPGLIAADVIATAGGFYFTLQLKSDGTLWAVGANDQGQLGDGTTTERTSPVLIASGVAKIAAGFKHSLFVKANGTLWAMGANDYGQLGDGTFVRRLSPVQVATGVMAVSTTRNHTLFLKTDGSLFGVGLDADGQLGDGATTNRSEPVQIAAGVVSASAGARHSLFVTADGSLWAAGDNGFGQLGDSTNARHLSPVPIASRVSFAACGQYESFFVKEDGSLWAMGRNLFGDLGDGTLVNRNVPTQITASAAPAMAPGGVTASDGTFTDKVQVTWTPQVDATRYEVWRATANVPATATRLADQVRAVSYDDTNAVAGTTYYYWVKAGNDTGSGGFSAGDAGFLLADAPAIITQPSNRLANVGSPVTLVVIGTGSPAVQYQWFKDGVAIDGATADTLAFASPRESDAGHYTVRLSNSLGTVTSAVMTLTVIPAGLSGTQVVLGSGYVPGGTVTIGNVITYGGTAPGLSWQVLLPTGWSYVSGTGTAGATTPEAGVTGLVEWTWTALPANPVAFTYVLAVPADATGDQVLATLVTVSADDGPIQFLAQPDPLNVRRIIWHSADTDHDLRIGLLELLRVIELYNVRNGTARTGAYAADPTNHEDGFGFDPARPRGAVVTLAKYHSADADHDGLLDLNELLRVIELYNYRSGTVRTGQYHVAPLTEDDFDVGP